MTNSIKHRTRRHFAGSYTRTDGTNEVTVYSADFGYGTEWIAAADWDRHMHTDPVKSKWFAIQCADQMLTERREEMGL